MALFDRNISQRTFESSLGSFAQRVYGWMTLGLITTALIAYLLINSGAYVKVLPYWWVTGLASLGIGMAFNSMAGRISFGALGALFLTYAALQGLFFGSVLPLYAAQFGGQTVWMAFLTASVTFGISVLYGVFTRTDLTRFSRILQMALIGLIATTLIVAVVSLFTPLTGFDLLISYAGLVIFVGLTAHDAQMIRKVSHEVDGNSAVAMKGSLLVAMRMYINVIMIFWYLLQILSSSRRSS